MEKVKILETNLKFSSLTRRYFTDLIVIHHTGADLDADAKTIHKWHLENGWAGIGYHFVIRRNGAIERGRAVNTVGSHCYGFNYNSIGIHLSGDFELREPASLQIESCAMLIANLAADYNIPLDRNHIKGHKELVATDCPGKYLYDKMSILVGKANWYRYI